MLLGGSCNILGHKFHFQISSFYLHPIFCMSLCANNEVVITQLPCAILKMILLVSHILLVFHSAKGLWNQLQNIRHCVKSGLIRSFSDPHFPAFGLNTEIHYYFNKQLGSDFSLQSCVYFQSFRDFNGCLGLDPTSVIIFITLDFLEQ